MDKSTVFKMINADIVGFNNQKSEISETLEFYKTEFKGYMDDLLSQMTIAGSAPLFTKTPKAVKKKFKRIKTIREDDEIENDSNLSNTRMTRASRVNVILETSDIYQGRSKRGVSNKPVIKQLSDDKTDSPFENKTKGNRSKRQKELLESSEDEERRPSKMSKIAKKKTLSKSKSKDETHDIINDLIEDADENQTISLGGQKKTSVKRKLDKKNKDETHDIINDLIEDADENQTISSEGQNKTSVERKLEENNKDETHDIINDLIEDADENQTISSGQKKKSVKRKLEKNNKDETHDIINDLIEDADENQTISSGQKKKSVKRKLEKNKDANTLISEQSSRQKSLPTDEPVAKKANYSKIISPKNDKNVNTLEKLSKQSSSNQSEVLNKRSTRSSASVINAQGSSKYIKADIINETIDMSNGDEMVASMYEDAFGKPVPIMNSTMNPNITVTLEKMMNATVVIEPLSIKNKFNETVTITKKKSSFKEPLSNSTIKESEEYNANTTRTIVHKAPENTNNITVNYGKVNAKTRKDTNLEKFSELLTDDESSPECKGYRLQKQKLLNQQKRVTRSNTSTMSEEELFQTPIKILQKNKDLKANTLKKSYKPSAFFSPYAKDSVKKRVEAFEQVASPKTNENETGGRVTRTKTRALANTSFSEVPPQTAAQTLARKSLAKAKKISLAKQIKEYDETKEYENTTKTKQKKATSSLEKSAQKSQLKTTPLGKRTLQMPSSVNKNQYATPSNTHNLNAHSKPMSASRGNVVTHLDSFIQPMKSAQKTIDRAAEEKRRRAHEEDARRKREELLKAQAEEKKRKREEKELKNKLAREAKEKLDQEKRLKTEREKEEKAKLAQQMQEKHKEEMEKKRIAQLQRAQIKEERRKQEEQLRLQRLQEQEELEKLLAEQKRREQEQEKRKLLAEAKLKNQALTQAKVKVLAQKLVSTNYKIDSDPDEEESDDERKPKHPIPLWASRHVRQAQLEMQQYIPMKILTKFFDAKKCTPDLRELFVGIDPKKLKRSSSAIWRTPPRYSMMGSALED